MFNNFIAEKKEYLKSSISVTYNQFLKEANSGIKYISSDYKAAGIAWGAISYACPALILLPLAAALTQAEGTAPFIIGSVMGLVGAPLMLGIVSGLLPTLSSGIGSLTGNIIANSIKFAGAHPFIAASGIGLGYLIYSAEKVEAMTIPHNHLEYTNTTESVDLLGNDSSCNILI